MSIPKVSIVAKCLLGHKANDLTIQYVKINVERLCQSIMSVTFKFPVLSQTLHNL